MTWLAPLDIGIVMGLLMAWAVISLALSFNLLDFPDLTPEGSLPLGAILFAALIKTGTSLWLAIIAAMVAGAAAGALTAFIHIRFRLNKFLAGILVVAISYSICLRTLGTSNIGLLNSPSLFDYVVQADGVAWGLHIGTAGLLGVLLVAGACLVLWGVQTRRGLRVRVAGSNPIYAKSIGINVPASLILGLSANNAMAALAGALLAMHQGFADVGMGQGILILALASMALGEHLVPERRLPFHVFVVISAAFGSILYQVLIAYAVRLGLDPVDLKLATALLVLAVIALKASEEGHLLSERP